MFKDLKGFFSYYKPHKRLFILDLLAAILVSACNLFYPLVSREFINKYVPNQNIQMIIITAALLFVVYFIKYWLEYFIQYWGHVMGVRIQCDIRRDAFDHLQKLPFTYFDQSRSGTIMSRVINDTENIAEFAHHGPEELLVSVLSIVGAFVVLLTINVPLTLIIFAALPILFAFAVHKRAVLSKTSMDTRVKIGQVNADLENSIAGVRISKAYGSAKTDLAKFQKGNEDFAVAASKRYKAMGQFYSGTTFIINLLTLITLLFSGFFAFKRWITIGDFTAYLLFIASFTEPVKGITLLVDLIQSGATGFKRIKELLDVPTEQDSPNAKELVHVKGAILFDRIAFKYDTAHTNVFDGMSLHVNAGETLALVGPSGGGKSTLCHLLPRFYELDGGKILLDGQNINDYTRFSLRKQIGIVQQDTFLFTGTIKDNISYGDFNATDEEIIAAATAANIHDYVATLPEGYNTFIGERGVMLSGGQKQRISIARIFLKNPPILILDEATSALDNATEHAIQGALNDLSAGRTTLIVAHRLSTIRGANQIVYIADNEIKEQGTHDELLAKDSLYAELWNAQMME